MSGALANTTSVHNRRRARVHTAAVNDKLDYYYTGQIVLSWSCKQFFGVT